MDNRILEKEAFRHHSDEIDEIITKIPSWILRRGIMLFGVILLMTLILSNLIHYPDTLKQPVWLQADSHSTDLMGVLYINEENFSKVKLNQNVLVELTIFPKEQFGLLHGKILSIADEPNRLGLFSVKVKFNSEDATYKKKLKSWMTGRAEIILQDVTLFIRVSHSIVKL